MPEKNVRPSDEIKEFGKGMERRMRAKLLLIKEGHWPHWKQMSVQDLIDRARGCLEELEAIHKGGQGDPMKKSYDLGNFARFIGLRLAGPLPASHPAAPAQPEDETQAGDEE